MGTWKDKKNIAIVLFSLFCIAVIGCNSMLDHGTPAWRHYLVANFLDDPNSTGLTSLSALKEDNTRILMKYHGTQKTLLREAEDNSWDYKAAKGFIDLDIKNSQAFQDAVVGSPGNPSSILGLLAAVGLAGAAGRAMKRKGDRDENEVEAEIVKRMQEKV